MLFPFGSYKLCLKYSKFRDGIYKPNIVTFHGTWYQLHIINISLNLLDESSYQWLFCNMKSFNTRTTTVSNIATDFINYSCKMSHIDFYVIVVVYQLMYFSKYTLIIYYSFDAQLIDIFHEVE